MVQTHTVWRVPAEAGVGLFLRTLTVLPGVSQGQNGRRVTRVKAGSGEENGSYPQFSTSLSLPLQAN